MKKNIYFIGIIITIMLTTFFLFKYKTYKDLNKNDGESIDYIVEMGHSVSIERASYFITTNVCDARDVCRNVYFGNNIIYFNNHIRYIDILLNKQDDPYIREEVINFVDIDTGMKVQSINLNSLYGTQGKNSFFTTMPINIDGSDVLAFKSATHDKYLYYFMDSEKIVENVKNSSITWRELESELYLKNSKEKSYNQYLLTNKSFLEANSLLDKLEFSNTHNYFDGIPLYIKISDVPLSNKMKEAFPQLYQYKMNNPNSDYYVSFIFPYEFSADEIVELLIGDVETVSYEGVMVSADYSIDEQDHDIDNFDEYLKYIDREKTYLFGEMK